MLKSSLTSQLGGARLQYGETATGSPPQMADEIQNFPIWIRKQAAFSDALIFFNSVFVAFKFRKIYSKYIFLKGIMFQ